MFWKIKRYEFTTISGSQNQYSVRLESAQEDGWELNGGACFYGWGGAEHNHPSIHFVQPLKRTIK